MPEDAVAVQVRNSKETTQSAEGEWFWVCENEYGLTSHPVQSSLYPGIAPPRLKVWDTSREAIEDTKGWGGHPWWVKPDTVKVIQVEPVYEKVRKGWREVSDA